jgi:hypothetical protein
VVVLFAVAVDRDDGVNQTTVLLGPHPFRPVEVVADEVVEHLTVADGAWPFGDTDPLLPVLLHRSPRYSQGLRAS